MTAPDASERKPTAREKQELSYSRQDAFHAAGIAAAVTPAAKVHAAENTLVALMARCEDDVADEAADMVVLALGEVAAWLRPRRWMPGG